MNPTSPDDTIAAIATPPGEGGIGIVRLSGPEAVPIAGRLFVSASGRRLDDGTRQVYYGEVRDGEDVLDEVLVHVMRGPRSYTREDVVEINAHGGAGPLHAILERALCEGARLAEPGEFTRRAFLNGRIDLVQAEAVIDRIQAQTRAGLQAASAAARGVLSQELKAIRQALVLAKSHIEAAIDFPDQDLPDLITPELREALHEAQRRMEHLLDTADAGRLLREGAKIAIAGRPNVGKSSLFNALLRDARAIVTARAGTTRDLIHEVITLDGIPVRLTDTAGLRETDDEVERMGVAVARQAVSEAALILLVVDAAAGLQPDDERLFAQLRTYDLPILLVLNKIDIGDKDEIGRLNGSLSAVCRVSALTGQGLADLEESIAALLRGHTPITADQALITRIHQKHSLRRALDAVNRVQEHFENSPEFMGIELDEALRALGEITGETTPDEVLDLIFGSFCIGK